MAHNRKLVLSGVALIKARLRHDIPALSKVRDDIERELVESEFFDHAPFNWIGLTIRFGLENKLVPEYQGINKTYGDLAVAVEINVRPLVGADIESYESCFRLATIAALRHVAEKYKLPADRLR